MISLVFSLLSLFHFNTLSTDTTSPIPIGIAGLTHDHVNWVFNQNHQEDILIVGIAEPDQELVRKYADRYGFSMDLVYDSLEEMINSTSPVAVMAFGSIYEHLEVVQVCAPRDIHVMVEKPLAVNMEHALEMKRLAKNHNIHLLTNYETTWYASNQEAYHVTVDQKELGTIRKIVIRDGHRGPKEIGCSDEFLEWLTDPIMNGGGAIVDFGCYGANLATWLMKNRKPNAVWGITQQLKPDLYPKVDDEATIILEYPEGQVIIQASWNWPFSRKDMSIYGESGSFFARNSQDIEIHLRGNKSANTSRLSRRIAPYDNPFSYLAAVVRGKISVQPGDLSSLENNMIVVEILDAARWSAQTGKKVVLKD